MIEFISINGLIVPKIFCNSCGEEITNVKQAAVVFKNFMENAERVPLTYVHKDFVKGSCMSKAEEVIRSRGEEPGWWELAQHLAYLVSNVGMTAKDIEDQLAK